MEAVIFGIPRLIKGCTVFARFLNPRQTKRCLVLGQHQNAQMNYKGDDVELWQYNTVAVVPFMYSNKNYGLLWDNYSRSRFGDMRDYEPLSTLKLYDAAGNEGSAQRNLFSF
jgi:hypothetical protein